MQDIFYILIGCGATVLSAVRLILLYLAKFESNKLILAFVFKLTHCVQYMENIKSNHLKNINVRQTIVSAGLFYDHFSSFGEPKMT